MTIANTLRTINSRNVIAKLEGADPKLKDEFVVYTAHWDHFGKNADGIFHGAEDDALGCAALIEMGRAFTKLPSPPRRSILFLAVTAEEQGLLGSQFYSVTPIYPLAKTVADINMDSWNTHGRTKDMTLTGYGASELDDYARDAAAEQGRVVHGDAEPEKGFYYRSDHFNFAKQGVPALDIAGGVDYVGKPPEFGAADAEGMDRKALPHAARRRDAGLGSVRHARGSGGAARRRPARGAGGQVSRLEARQRVQGQARRDAEEIRRPRKARKTEVGTKHTKQNRSSFS